MRDRFPPTPDNGHEYRALLSILVSVLGSRKADYVSSPLTGGPAFIEWFQREGHRLPHDSEEYRVGHRQIVVQANIAAAQRVVQRFRASGEIVVEPTSFDTPHWTQNDYRHLWGLVIQQHVKRVVFLDGWPFSNGCAYEFWVATKAGIETTTSEKRRITREHGTDAIEKAMREMQRVGLSTAFIQDVLASLRSAHR